jgi:hypothetical protein
VQTFANDILDGSADIGAVAMIKRDTDCGRHEVLIGEMNVVVQAVKSQPGEVPYEPKFLEESKLREKVNETTRCRDVTSGHCRGWQACGIWFELLCCLVGSVR